MARSHKVGEDSAEGPSNSPAAPVALKMRTANSVQRSTTELD